MATPKAASGGSEVCNWTGPDLNCKEFKKHKDAQASYNYCVSLGYGDIFNLDGSDNDV